MNRRQLMTAAMAGSVAGASSACASNPRTDKPITFVLVHGTWHGGWVWRDVRNALEDLGHRVFTPTLTGCGEREHLSRPDVGLDTHIQDIVNVIEFEDLNDIVLVGHSFTGLAITGVADRLKDRIRHICYFDAIVPSENRLSAIPRDAEGNLPDSFLARQTKFVDGYKMVLWEEYPIDMLVPPGSPHADRIKQLITTHPAKTWTDRLDLRNGGWAGLSRSFIHCVGQAYKMSSERMVGPARAPGWHFIELDIPRDGMVTHPDLVTRTFLEIAAL